MRGWIDKTAALMQYAGMKCRTTRKTGYRTRTNVSHRYNWTVSGCVYRFSAKAVKRRYSLSLWSCQTH